MKRWVSVPVLTVVLLLVAAWPAVADRGRRHIHRPFVRSHAFFGPTWWGPHPYWWGYRPYYVYSPPPAVVVEQPPVYIQQGAPAPPPPPPPPAESYWHYCVSAKAYYPNVGTCPEPWVKVPPRAP
jgi:hypothetical protein